MSFGKSYSSVYTLIQTSLLLVGVNALRRKSLLLH